MPAAGSPGPLIAFEHIGVDADLGGQVTDNRRGKISFLVGKAPILSPVGRVAPRARACRASGRPDSNAKSAAPSAQCSASSSVDHSRCIHHASFLGQAELRTQLGPGHPYLAKTHSFAVTGPPAHACPPDRSRRAAAGKVLDAAERLDRLLLDRRCRGGAGRAAVAARPGARLVRRPQCRCRPAPHLQHSAAIDLLAAAPLVSATSLAAGLGMAIKNAARLLDAFCADGIAVEVTHRCKRRLFALRTLAPLREGVAVPRRPVPGRGRGRPRTVPVEAEVSPSPASYRAPALPARAPELRLCRPGARHRTSRAGDPAFAAPARCPGQAAPARAG